MTNTGEQVEGSVVVVVQYLVSAHSSLVFLFGLTLFLGTFTTCFLISHLHMALRNTTTAEAYRWSILTRVQSMLREARHRRKSPPTTPPQKQVEGETASHEQPPAAAAAPPPLEDRVEVESSSSSRRRRRIKSKGGRPRPRSCDSMEEEDLLALDMRVFPYDLGWWENLKQVVFPPSLYPHITGELARQGNLAFPFPSEEEWPSTDDDDDDVGDPCAGSAAAATPPSRRRGRRRREMAPHNCPRDSVHIQQ